MKKLLITGFNPFDERGYNTSGEVLSHLPEKIQGYRLIKRVIPVEWENGKDVLLAHCQQVKPDAIFSMGMSKNPFLQFELVARNKRKPELTDNLNQTPASERISPKAPLTLPCNWPIPAPLPQLLSNSLRLEPSEDAGGYLCNQTFFLASTYGAKLKTKIPVAFVHIPPKSSDGGIAIEKTAVAVLDILEISLKQMAPRF